MASPAQLVRTVSLVTGLPLPTIVDIDRKLVEAKLRTKGGRGFSAARMTSLDAARLLTAILASPQANVAASAVVRYAATHPDRTRSSDAFFASAKLNDLAALPANHSFVDGLAAVIASAVNGPLAKIIAAADERAPPTIEVFAFTQATRGRIRIAGLPNGLTASMEYVPAPTAAKPPRAKKVGRRHGAPGDEDTGDLEQSRRITERTILPIAKLLVEEKYHDRD
jgi:hypothetical protein